MKALKDIKALEPAMKHLDLAYFLLATTIYSCLNFDFILYPPNNQVKYIHNRLIFSAYSILFRHRQPLHSVQILLDCRL